MEPRDRQNYTNQYLVSYKDTKSGLKTVLIPKAVSHFNRALNIKIQSYTQFT